MTTDEARQLFAYGTWANGLVFDAAEALTVEHLEAPAASSFPSVLGTLAHIVGAEWIWLHRWLGESRAAPAWVTSPNLAELKREFAMVESERDLYLSKLSDADLERVVSYRNLAGKAYADRLSDLVRHVANHSTYHRGQIATQLRQLGHIPPNTDLITYVRQAK